MDKKYNEVHNNLHSMIIGPWVSTCICLRLNWNLFIGYIYVFNQIPAAVFQIIIREEADAVDFRTQTKIKIYSFNFKDPSF